MGEMLLTWKYSVYVAFMLLTFFACINVRMYFKGMKYQDRWSCLSGVCFGLLGVVITQPPERMPSAGFCVVAIGLAVYSGLRYFAQVRRRSQDSESNDGRRELGG